MKRLGCIRVVEELGGRRTECTSSAPLAWRHIVTYVQQRASRLASRVSRLASHAPQISFHWAVTLAYSTL